MNKSEAKAILRGPMVPVLTHYADDLSVHLDATRENAEHLLAAGFSTGNGALLAAGAGGDFPMLSLEERQTVAQTIINAAGGKVPVVVGAQDTDPQRIIAMARFAEDAGAAAIQMAPSYYYRATADDCRRLFKEVHEATSSIGLMIYNTHWEGYDMPLSAVDELAKLPRCVSLKWSSGEGTATYLRGVARFAKDLAVIDNHGLPVMNHMLGGTGYITHLASIWPEHELAVWKLLEAGEYKQAQAKITECNWPWYDFRVKMAGRTGAESPVVAAAMDLCGRYGGPSRSPARALNEDERSELKSVLQRIGVPAVTA